MSCPRAMSEWCDEWSGEQYSALALRSRAADIERPAAHRTARGSGAPARAYGLVSPFTDGAYEPVVNHFARFGDSRDDVQQPVPANLADAARSARIPFADGRP